MKKNYSIFILIMLLSFCNYAHAAISTPITASGLQMAKPTVAKLTKLDFKKLSVSEIEAKIGHKLTRMQRLAVKLIKKSDEGNAGIGFALGFFAGAIGLVIAYVVFKEQPKTIRGALWGFGTWVVLSIATTVIILSRLPK